MVFYGIKKYTDISRWTPNELLNPRSRLYYKRYLLAAKKKSNSIIEQPSQSENENILTKYDFIKLAGSYIVEGINTIQFVSSAIATYCNRYIQSVNPIWKYFTAYPRRLYRYLPAIITRFKLDTFCYMKIGMRLLFTSFVATTVMALTFSRNNKSFLVNTTKGLRNGLITYFGLTFLIIPYLYIALFRARQSSLSYYRNIPNI